MRAWVSGEIFRRFKAFVLICGLLAAGATCSGHAPAPRPAVYRQIDQAAARGVRQLARGHDRAARKSFETALRLARSVEAPEETATALVNLARLYAETGRPEKIPPLVAEALSAAPPGTALFAEAALERARLALRRNRYEEAVLWADRTLAASPDASATALAARTVKAAARLRSGGSADAERMLHQLIDAATAEGRWVEAANAHRVRAEGALSAGAFSAAAGDCRIALEHDRRAGRSRGVVLDLFCLADAAALAGKPKESGAFLDRAARVIENSGDVPDLETALHERRQQKTTGE